MGNDRTPLDGGLALDAEKNRHRVMLESVYKFRFFFVGLIFAILSFSLQFPVKTQNPYVIAIEIFSWILLVISGFFALKDCGGFASKLTGEVLDGLVPFQRRAMWLSFFTAMVLMLAAKILDALIGILNKTT